MPTTPEAIVQRARDAGVRLVQFLYCDNGAIIRGKNSALPSLPGRINDGIGLTVAMMAMNSLDQLQPVDGMGAVGEIRLVPDPASFVVLPHPPHSAAMMCDMITNTHEPWAGCPRSFLKRMRERAAAKGFYLQAAIEAEFSLATRDINGVYQPFDQTLCFSTAGMAMAGLFVSDLVAALESQGTIVEQYYPELGHGQHEITIRHQEVLRAADNHLWLRQAIHGVAQIHHLVASLAPKPFADQAGNGGHIHFSLWNEAEQNCFYDPAASDGLSLIGRQFMAGVLAHLPALVAITCPSVNSYQRLQPQAWSSAYAIWGHDNREAAVRVASPFWSDVAGSTNLELKAADSSSNPYLALGALLAAGLDGIERELDPGDSVEVDPGTLSAAQRKKRGITRLPETLEAALQALEADQLLIDALGPLLARSFLAVRRSEIKSYAAMDPATQFATHFEKY